MGVVPRRVPVVFRRTLASELVSVAGQSVSCAPAQRNLSPYLNTHTPYTHMANDCSLSALVCDDQDQTITNFIEQKGIITDFVYSGIRSTDPMIRLLEGSKKTFPEGMGDSITRGILEVTSPNELDGLNWNPVRSNYPGNSACCNTYRDFTYGSRTVHGCLNQIGYKSPTFCKTDVVFKTKFLDQLMQIVMAMRNITTGVWSHWLRASYPRSVYNTILSKLWGHPEQLGSYPQAARPTTFINVEHLDILSERITSVGGLIGSPIQGFKVILIGKNAYLRLKQRRMEQNANLVGASGANLSLPNYAEYTDGDLGQIITWAGYAFILTDKPRRFREPVAGETWEDALVPSTINVATDKGEKTERNPDYYNPNIALYEETLWINREAVDWLVPPAALIKSMSAGGKEFFPATNYAGDFEAVHCPLDPKKKTVQFMADFMAGMMSLFPQKGRAIMHKAVHLSACDDDDNVCLAGAPGDTYGGNYIRQVATNATPGQLQILVEGTLPEACPPGHSLFLETEKGERYLVGSVVSTWAFAGSPEFPQAGNYYVVALASGLTAAATTRELCDPWKRIVCLPSVTQSSDPSVSPCGVCNQDTTPADTTCVLTVVVTSDRIRGLVDADGVDTIAVTNYTSAATLQAAIQAWLTSNGGGTATVTGGTSADSYEWTIQISGSSALAGGSVVYDDGLVDDATKPFSQQGVCTAT